MQATSADTWKSGLGAERTWGNSAGTEERTRLLYPPRGTAEKEAAVVKIAMQNQLSIASNIEWEGKHMKTVLVAGNSDPIPGLRPQVPTAESAAEE